MRKSLLLLISLLGSSAAPAWAQYYGIANQIASALQAPLSGSSRYKGFVEASYTRGLGNINADFLEFTTTQGYQYNSWFFMGVGLGAQVVFGNTESRPETLPSPTAPGWNLSSHTTGVMIPLYTDFRFTPWGRSTGLYLDLRAGASFLIGRDYLNIGQGYINNQEYFYFKPSLGIKVPVSKDHPDQAFDIGLSYQLLTANYWYGYTSSRVLNNLGLSVGFEW